MVDSIETAVAEEPTTGVRIVQKMTRPPMTRVERYTRANPDKDIPSYTIAGILLNGSNTILQPRVDDPTRVWRNEIGDVLEMLPNSDRLVLQRGVLLNWSQERGTDISDLDSAIVGLDVDAETGAFYTRDELLLRLKAFNKASAGAVAATAASVEAVFEAPPENAPEAS